eukprot:TRINITY_DN31697_c0_g1_i1.p1 TRINITY_DN31697_c0_g1~~TRINITY_DN31697_c0_g1_i1.p1  ORF type:complete len:551 (-),score=65.53 TRINITY_DN31697_c0_g1_i1:145-1698(-)
MEDNRNSPTLYGGGCGIASSVGARPVFQGQSASSQVSERPLPKKSFAWRDLQKGGGDFTVGKDETACASRDSWRFVALTTKQNVTVGVYSRQLPDNLGLSQYLIRGSLPIPRDVFFALNADNAFRMEWDTTTVAIRELWSSNTTPATTNEGSRELSRALQWSVNYPWPLGARDYVLEQTIHTEGSENDGSLMRCISSEASSRFRDEVGTNVQATASSETNVTRIENYRSHMAIWSGTGPEEVCFTLLCMEDPKVHLPNWLVSKVAATTVPSSLTATIPAAKAYPAVRLQQLMIRFSGPTELGRGFLHEAAPEDDAESFYSASDDETSPRDERSALEKRVAARGRRLAGAGAGAARSPERTRCQPTPLGVQQDSSHAAHAAAEWSAGGSSPDAVLLLASKSQITSGAAESTSRRSAAVAASESLAAKERRAPQQQLTQMSLKAASASAASAVSAAVVASGAFDLQANLEEGLLVLSKEEKALLMEVLTDTRKKSANRTSWGLPFCCCRRRCGRLQKRS